jgi:sarcosine/dimethylglycine N-methyltransferase
MNDTSSQLFYFYNRHPISRDIIVAKLRASRGHLDKLRPEDLYAHDQDHYGGVNATDELARQAQIGSGTAVADFCAGLGGTVPISRTNTEPTSPASNLRPCALQARKN